LVEPARGVIVGDDLRATTFDLVNVVLLVVLLIVVVAGA
jgi:hypothetical protein